MNPPEATSGPCIRAPHEAASIDRLTWLDQRRAAVIACYDREALGYDDHGYPAETQQRWVARLLHACRAASIVFDAACGTAPVFLHGRRSRAPRRRHRSVGRDAGPGPRARHRDHLNRVGLQELRYLGEFNVVLCIDAMENIPPEHWPLVLANLHRAMRPGGLLYLTVEEVADSVLEEAFAALTGQGLRRHAGRLSTAMSPDITTTRAATALPSGAMVRVCSSSTRTSSKKTAGATATSCSKAPPSPKD